MQSTISQVLHQQLWVSFTQPPPSSFYKPFTKGTTIGKYPRAAITTEGSEVTAMLRQQEQLQTDLSSNDWTTTSPQQYRGEEEGPQGSSAAMP